MCATTWPPCRSGTTPAPAEPRYLPLDCAGFAGLRADDPFYTPASDQLLLRHDVLRNGHFGSACLSLAITCSAGPPVEQQKHNGFPTASQRPYGMVSASRPSQREGKAVAQHRRVTQISTTPAAHRRFVGNLVIGAINLGQGGSVLPLRPARPLCRLLPQRRRRRFARPIRTRRLAGVLRCHPQPSLKLLNPRHRRGQPRLEPAFCASNSHTRAAATQRAARTRPQSQTGHTHPMTATTRRI